MLQQAIQNYAVKTKHESSEDQPRLAFSEGLRGGSLSSHCFCCLQLDTCNDHWTPLLSPSEKESMPFGKMGPFSSGEYAGESGQIFWSFQRLEKAQSGRKGGEFERFWQCLSFEIHKSFGTYLRDVGPKGPIA